MPPLVINATQIFSLQYRCNVNATQIFSLQRIFLKVPRIKTRELVGISDASPQSDILYAGDGRERLSLVAKKIHMSLKS